MVELFSKGFSIFTYATGLSGELWAYRQYASLGLWFVGILLCFFGFRSYRFFFSAGLFAFVAVMSCLGLKEYADWGEIVTSFSVIGTVLAIFGFYWYRLGGTLVCAAIGGAIGWTLLPSCYMVVVGAVLAMGAVLLFPVMSICLVTSIGGGLLLAELGAGWKGLILAAAGLILQLRISRNQNYFKKTCPDRFSYWMEKRRRK